MWLLWTVLVLVVVTLIVLLTRRSGAGDTSALLPRMDNLDKGQERAERVVREEVARNRDELATRLQGFNDSVLKQLAEQANIQNNRLDTLARSTEQKLDALQQKVDGKLGQIQQENSTRLEEMRKTVDEKLQGTLEKRLGESFKLVTEQLKQVHQGLGEMQALANGVGDLKKVLTNVKTRGIWGEIQLGALLEQVLTPDQYERNVKTHGDSGDAVEFAIKLPGRDEDGQKQVWLPIDAKFPREDYERLIEASERGDAPAVAAAAQAIELRIKLEAKTISEKYVDPPHTTDFAILFLPIEGLYSEVLRRPGLVELLQRQYRVNVAGPTTLAALLNSLQMGFRTLAIEKRTSEVWKVLAAVKAEFEKFGKVLDGVHRKLQEASTAIEDEVARRTRVINRRLRNVQSLPGPDATALLGEETKDVGDDTEDAG